MTNKPRIIATIEARMTSTRLPGKVLLPILNKPALLRMIERVRYSKFIDSVVVATTHNDSDDPIVAICRDNEIPYFRGSENDVLDRVLKTGKIFQAEVLVELTGDCPLIDPDHIDTVIENLLSGDFDYSSNIETRSFPDGFDVQAFWLKTLEKVDQLTDDPIDRVHVTYYILRNLDKFRTTNFCADEYMFWPELGLTLDEMPDYVLISKVFESLYSNDKKFSARDIVTLLRNNQSFLELNAQVRRKKPEEG